MKNVNDESLSVVSGLRLMRKMRGSSRLSRPKKKLLHSSANVGGKIDERLVPANTSPTKKMLAILDT